MRGLFNARQNTINLYFCFYYTENRTDNKLWRIADFSEENRGFIKANYTEKGDNEYLPR